MFEGYKVVFVEDDLPVRVSLTQTLELEGFTVVPCRSAEEALPHVQPGAPIVVVTDVRLPGMDGRALLAHVQTTDAGIPTILITAHGDVAMAVQAMRAGAYDFIEKPFAPERLVDVVRRAACRATLAQEPYAAALDPLLAGQRLKVIDGEVRSGWVPHESLVRNGVVPPAAAVRPLPAQAVGGLATDAALNTGGRFVVLLQVSCEKPLRPEFWYSLDIHTKAGWPVKMPTPPRSWLRPSPVTSQLKPTRGEICQLPLGSSAVLRPSVSRTPWLKGGLSGNIETSARRPAVTVRRFDAAHSSCTYSACVCWWNRAAPSVPVWPGTPIWYDEAVPFPPHVAQVPASESSELNCQ